ncbi:S-adenosyl-L-methionine-dependent methyltransferase [Xylaria arbuscula]|nr:S-adenosyl-L-methionine-dependent methyltransferase [Xylaria arbuscula]
MEALSPTTTPQPETSVAACFPDTTGGNVVVSLPSSTLTQPASHFDGFTPPAPEASEGHAVVSLLQSLGNAGDDDFIEFDLTSFSIYIDTGNYPNELRPLQHLKSRSLPGMYFDGLLQHGDKKFYLRKVPFSKLPVGNYGETNHTVGDQIWILSKLNEKLGREIYYKLHLPALEYRRFHMPFLWVADLAKHVIDYCEHCRDENHHVVLSDFKSRFSTWLTRTHGTSTTFARWHARNRSTDFRVAVVASIDYIFEEAKGIDPEIASWHHVWREAKTLDYYEPSFNPCAAGEISKTIVTPYVHDLFSHMVFGELLEPKQACASTEVKKIESVRQSQPLPLTQPDRPRGAVHSDENSTFIEHIQPGDVISTLPDSDATTDTEWKRGSSRHCNTDYHWYGLVQKVHVRPYGKRSFDVLWLYQPIDTPCSVMKYPWANELFLSDNCTCHHPISKVQGHEVISTHEVEWFGSPSTSAEFFVRQTYIASDCRWASLRKEHFICGDERVFSQELNPSFRVGDTVLVKMKNLQLGTFVIEGFLQDTRYARMRRLWRRRDVDNTASLAPPNELVYSEQFAEIDIKRIDRRCIVRTFQVDEDIPPPYNRNGTGDAFFITHQQVEIEGVTRYRPLLNTHRELFRQGFYHNKMPKLRGLDLFCGGGNFGRGIEDGDGVEMRWCNDLWEGAIHSYMANADHERCTPFLGSIDDLLAHALNGDPKVPAPGDVEFISAGSPVSLSNQSLVASFASFVELYRPLYGVLENVPAMVNTSSLRDSCVFSQLVCALVGLGYQVQVYFLDAWSFGSAQSRSRVFLAFTAPGLRTPKAPEPSHSHPENTLLLKLGEMSCGRPFDSRKIVPTAFKFVSLKEAVGDLPNVQDGKADFCVGYPDHRLSIGYTPKIRKQLALIPTHPYGMNFYKAWAAGVLTPTERLLFPEDGKERARPTSKGWGRLDPNGLVGTIPTTCLPTDARVGRINHWEQNRPLTILEARRAQGFLDHEVIVGTRADQYRVIGNSVSRHVALVLGLAIREAWVGTLLDEDLNANIEPQVIPNLDVTVTESLEETLTMETLTTSTPCSLGAFTPATSEPAEGFDDEIHRKRSQTTYVDLTIKKRRFGTFDDPIEIS